MSRIADALDQLEERAAILEFDGRIERGHAEAQAIEALLEDDSFGPGVKREAIRIFRERIREQCR